MSNKEELDRIEKSIEVQGFADLAGRSTSKNFPQYVILPLSFIGLSELARGNLINLHKTALLLLETEKC